jgi:hypothetical protein
LAIACIIVPEFLNNLLAPGKMRAVVANLFSQSGELCLQLIPNFRI